MKNKLYILSFACFFNINGMHQEENTANAANAQQQTESSKIDSNKPKIASLKEIEETKQKHIEADERLNRLTRSKENSQQTKDEFLALESILLNLKDSYDFLHYFEQTQVLESLQKLYKYRLLLLSPKNEDSAELEEKQRSRYSSRYLNEDSEETKDLESLENRILSLISKYSDSSKEDSEETKDLKSLINKILSEDSDSLKKDFPTLKELLQLWQKYRDKESKYWQILKLIGMHSGNYIETKHKTNVRLKNNIFKAKYFLDILKLAKSNEELISALDQAHCYFLQATLIQPFSYWQFYSNNNEYEKQSYAKELSSLYQETISELQKQDLSIMVINKLLLLKIETLELDKYALILKLDDISGEHP